MMSITILASGKSSLCKRFSRDGDVVRSKKAEMSSYFRFESRAVNDIDEFASLLTALEQDRSRFIIRGQLADDVDTDKPMRRRLYRSDGSEPNESPFLDVSTTWVMIDVDKLALPEGMSVRDDTLASLEYAIGLLPAEFQDSSVFWQLSGSAGVFDDGHISAHLYYWLDKPIANDVLRQWARGCDRRRTIK